MVQPNGPMHIGANANTQLETTAQSPSYIQVNAGAEIIIARGNLFQHHSHRGQPMRDFMLSNRWQAISCERVYRATQEVFETGNPLTLDDLVPHIDGNASLEINICPLLCEQTGVSSGAMIYVSHVSFNQNPTEHLDNSGEDTTNTAANQHALKHYERTQDAAESGRVSSWDWFPIDGGRLEISGFWKNEISVQETNVNGSLTTNEFAQIVHPDDLFGLQDAVKRCAAGTTDQFQVEHRIRKATGIYGQVLTKGSVVSRNELGEPTQFSGTFTDIDELKLSQTRLNLALANGRQALWEWLANGDKLILSESFHALFGYNADEIHSVADNFSKLIHPEDLQRVSASFTALLRTPNHNHKLEYRLRHKDGHYLWIQDQGIVVDRGKDGRALRAIGSQIDISAHHAAIDETRQAREFLQLILDEIPDKIFWKDENHRLLGCNRAYAEVVGASAPADLIGLTSRDIFPKDLADIYDADDNRVTTTGKAIIRTERRTIDQDGREFWTELTKLPLKINSANDNQKGLLCHYRDITLERARRKQLETLAEMMTGNSGTRTLDRLAEGTAELAHVDISFIGRFNAVDNSVTIVACNTDNYNLLDLSYELTDTPCGSVLDSSLCVFNHDVHKHFPNDFMLKDLSIESYAGKRLTDNSGETVGIFVLLNSSPIPEVDHATSLLEIVSAPASYELIREARETALIESEKRYRNIYDSVPVMICTTDKYNNIRDINSTWVETTGYIQSDVVGKPLTSLFRVSDKPTVLETISNSREGLDNGDRSYLRLISSTGEEIVVSHNAVVTTAVGNDSVTINVFEDMREQHLAAQRLRLAATAFETHEALVIRDHELNVLRVNAAFVEVTGFEQSAVLANKFRYFEPDDQQDVFQTANLAGKWDGNGKCQRADGSYFCAYQTVTAVKDENGTTTHFVENFNDITDYVEALAETERLAYFDSLTELPNRRYLTERLEESLLLAKNSQLIGALMFIDLDHFKNINDAVGHSVGDMVLQQVSKRLSKLLRAEDTIARLGGDEFVVLIPNISSNHDQATKQIAQIADKIQRDLRRLYYLGDHEFHITPTIGVTLFTGDDSTVDDVLKQADAAMYIAKEEGRNQTMFYNETMQDRAKERLAIEKDLRTAVQRGELSLVFQPQVDAEGDVFAAEALLRWHHPSRGLVSPALFIPIAEETGLIVEIGRWVLEEAFSTLADIDAQFPDNVIDHIAINVSSRQFSGQDFVEDVARRLKANGTNPRKVILEVTESTVIDKIQATVSKMEQLKQLGVRFSVDDFGTGYSSLAYLSRLPLDQLKIDRTFVSNIHLDPANAVIVETIISMGRHLGLQTIAEGVENEEQLEFLRARRCNAYQGFYFSKPLEITKFYEYINKPLRLRA